LIFDHYDFWLLAAVPVTGIAAGFINTLAGSGSLITLPILILLGLPANVANGTNRVGVVMQNVVAVANFRRFGALDAERDVEPRRAVGRRLDHRRASSPSTSTRRCCARSSAG
jgi:hypothetical protein